jgi:nitroreductase
MNLTETILQRRSVRTYTGEPLDEATKQQIKDYIATLHAPFGAVCRIEVVSSPATGEPVKLGTYGAISGATDFLALIITGDSPLAEVGAAYIFEQLVLFCTRLGLGTCWLGGFFSRDGFAKRLKLNPGERLRIASPVGYAADKHHLSILSIFVGTKPKPRKPFETNFFYREFGTPLTPERAGEYFTPLEMVRMAPSANNKQSWRVVRGEGVFHFYSSPSFGFDNIDLGIALCHFEQTCISEGIAGHFEVLRDAPVGQKVTYIISWIEG